MQENVNKKYALLFLQQIIDQSVNNHEQIKVSNRYSIENFKESQIHELILITKNLEKGFYFECFHCSCATIINNNLLSQNQLEQVLTNMNQKKVIKNLYLLCVNLFLLCLLKKCISKQTCSIVQSFQENLQSKLSKKLDLFSMQIELLNTDQRDIALNFLVSTLECLNVNFFTKQFQLDIIRTFQQKELEELQQQLKWEDKLKVDSFNSINLETPYKSNCKINSEEILTNDKNIQEKNFFQKAKKNREKKMTIFSSESLNKNQTKQNIGNVISNFNNIQENNTNVITNRKDLFFQRYIPNQTNDNSRQMSQHKLKNLKELTKKIKKNIRKKKSINQQRIIKTTLIRKRKIKNFNNQNLLNLKNYQLTVNHNIEEPPRTPQRQDQKLPSSSKSSVYEATSVNVDDWQNQIYGLSTPISKSQKSQQFPLIQL